MPTYNERENLPLLVHEIVGLVENNGFPLELLVVDDNSPDGTWAIAKELQGQYAGRLLIRLIWRPKKMGLSNAVVHGIENSVGEIIGVLDCDLSHPPKVLTSMLTALEDGCDIAIGSRYIRGGKISGWPLGRILVSRVATVIAQRLLKLRFHDPLSGFFAAKKKTIEDLKLLGIGYKPLLEILSRKRSVKIREIPYEFVNRSHGRSKLTLKDMINFLKLVAILKREWWKHI